MPNYVGSLKKQESSRKISTSAILTMSRTLTVWITANCGKFLNRWEYLRNRYGGQEATARTDMKQQTGSKSGKEYIKVVYCHPAYLTYMQSTSWETLGWRKHKLESRLPGEIPITSDMQMIPPYGSKWRTKELLDESKRGKWKSWLKTQHLKD